MGDFEKKKILQALVGRKTTACRTNVIESLWEKKGKKYPAHKIARKKIIVYQKFPPPPPLKSLNGRPLNKFLYSLRKLGTIN